MDLNLDPFHTHKWNDVSFGTNAHFAYRRSGYGGVETFFILGDPNATKFKKRIMTKVIWPM